MYHPSLKLGYWNVAGLNTNDDCNNKVNEYELINLVRRHDIICLAESHCGEEDVIHFEGQQFLYL